MGGRLDPPPWSAVGGLLENAAVLYAVLFGAAVTVSFLARSTHVRFLRDLLLQWRATAACWLLAARLAAFAARRAFALTVLRIFFSTLVCVVYVYVTYLGHIPLGVRVFQAALGVVLLLRFLATVVCAHNPVALMIHVGTLTETLSLSSLIFARGTVWLHFSFLQASIVLSSYFQVEPALEAMMVRKTSPFRRQLARLTLEFIVFIYIFACGLQLFEVLGDPTESLSATTFELTLANSLYFTVVTIFTVGYGDFVPYTLLGRLWIIFIIVFGAYLVSRKIGQVIDVVSGLRRGMGAFVKDEDVDHCVLCGNVKWEYLKTFVQEFFADVGNERTKVVVMCDQPNWTEDLWNSFFTSQTQFKDNVVYLEGACMTREDLLRAQVETALAVFILNNQHDPQPYLEDSETLKRILTVRAFSPNLPIYAMCALRDSMLQITVALEHDDADPMASSRSNPRAGAAARSGSFNAPAMEAGVHRSGGADGTALGDVGSGSLYGEGGIGLGGSASGGGGSSGAGAGRGAPIRSTFSVDFSDDDDDDDFMVVSDYDGMSDLKSDAICMQEVEMSLLAENVFCNGLSTLLSNLVLNVLPQTKPTDRPWMVEYKIGAECRLAYVKLPMDLHGKRFAQVAVTLYDYGILLLATKRFSDVKWRTITPDTFIHLNTIGLVVTFHSASFIDTIMQHAAQFLVQRDREARDTSDEDASSRGVPSVDDDADFHDDFLTGGADIDAGPTPAGVAGAGAADEGAAGAAGAAGTAGMAGTAAAAGTGLGSASQSLPRPPELDETLAASSPDVRAKNIGVTGSTAEGARLSDAEFLEEPGPGDVAAKQDVLVSLRDDGGGCEPFELKFQPAPRSASAVDLSTPALVDVDDLDTIADAFVAESGEDAPGKASPPSGLGSASASAAPEAVTAPPAGTKAEAAASGPASARAAREPGAAAANSGGGSAEEHAWDGRTRVGREASKVSFPDVLLKPKRRHSAHGGARFGKSASGPAAGVSGGKARAAKGAADSGARAAEKVFFGDAPLPFRLKGHIVVCVIGQMGLVNLKHFLLRVWMRRRGFKRETPVVAICPRITDAVEDDISLFSSNKLYVIQGNSLSIATLKRAQFDRARAIVVLACEDKNDVDHMDAKAIFTVMTLDYMLGERSNTFVCTMIDAEESMQLLRAPAHARRRGGNLGRDVDEYSPYGRNVRSPGPGRSLSSIGASQSFVAPQTPTAGGGGGGGGTAPSPSIPVPVPGSPVLRIQDYWTRAGGLSPTAAPARHLSASFGAGSGSLPRGDTLFSLGGNSINSFMDGPGPAIPASPAYVGSLTNRWSDRSVALRRIVTGEEPSPPAGLGPSLLRTSRTVSFLGIVGLGEESRHLRRLTTSASMGRGASSPANFLHPSASFNAGIPPTSLALPRVAMGPGGFGSAFEREASIATQAGGPAAAAGEPQGPGRKRSRDELFEKQRYASGEMMISSVYVALLIREFAMPGIMSVVRKIFGAGVGKNPRSKKCWIRTMKVPAQWAAGGDDGERTYRELFEVLLELNCIPLGIYRSGRAGVRVQLAMHEEVGDGGGRGGDADDESRPLLAGDVPAGPDVHSYTCPTTGHTAKFEQIPGGENVLPYVYTNPEPYTLISEHDAVYILAHPLLKIPDVWGE